MQLTITDHNKILRSVSKPARYVGVEWNAARKNWSAASVRMAFCFPDVYEVGMSHLGLQILYGLVNNCEPFLMDRVFAPWPDLETVLRQSQLPLFGLETRHSLDDFDLLGFTLQYELSYTNILNMLDLGNIPLRSDQRNDCHPLVIAGGPGAFCPEPLAPFIDAFVIGEGEEVLLELLNLIDRHQASRNGSRDRKQLLLEIAQIPGVYVPAAFSTRTLAGGDVVVDTPQWPGVPERIQKRILKNFDQAYFPDATVVPYVETVHDRVVLELFRGCQRGCRFCQAGMIYRPCRERSQDTLSAQARKLASSTGYEEISLVSLSSGDYSRITELIQRLMSDQCTRGMNISLPSLRTDSFSVALAREIHGNRKTTLTFAPEAGTQRLRDVINKGVTDSDVLEAARAAFEAGWSALKLYFMIGLPTETDADLDGIAELASQVLHAGKAVSRKSSSRRIEINVSVSNFVPKAHTPFQWEGQNSREELQRKQEYLRSKIRGRNLKLSWHDAEMSFWEAVLARGDRRIAGLIESAWKAGCRFDGWTEHFRPDLWHQAARVNGIEPETFAYRRYRHEEVLPWEHIDCGVSTSYLAEEQQRAYCGELTADCRFDSCSECGVCSELETALSGEWNQGEQRVSLSD